MSSLSFPKGANSVLYVGPKLNWFQRRALRSSGIRVKVIYLPDILKTLSKSACKYFFPSVTDSREISVKSLYAKVRAEVGEDISLNSRLIVWYDGDELGYFDAGGSFSNLLKFLKTQPLDPCNVYDVPQSIIEEDDSVQFCIRSTYSLADKTFDSHMQEVANDVKLQLKKLLIGGYPVEEILSWLSQNISLSHLRITKQYKISLVDYDIEIKMGPLPKTVFLFYLFPVIKI